MESGEANRRVRTRTHVGVTGEVRENLPNYVYSVSSRPEKDYHSTSPPQGSIRYQGENLMRLGSIQCRLLGVLVIGVACSIIAGSTSATATSTITVRIVPRAAFDYDLSNEVILRGQVVAREKDIILLRLKIGTVRVDTGSWTGSALLQPGTDIEVVAAKRQENGRQRFLAREIRYPGGSVVLRDTQGAPL